MNNIKQLQQAVKNLKAARDILEDRKAWIKDDYALTKRTELTDTLDEKACKFCSLGAIAKAVKMDGDDLGLFVPGVKHLASVVDAKFVSYLDEMYIAMFNDDPTTTHQDVLIAFDFAILQAEDDLKEERKAARN